MQRRKSIVQARPIIGVAMQTQEAIPGELPRVWILGQKYVRALTAAGALVWPVPLLIDNEEVLRAAYERFDGVFLTGGVDVDPPSYGETALSCCQETDAERDWVETRLTRWALADDKPLFGVCRGLQMINVALGGTLYQDIREQRPGAIRHDYFPTATEFSRDYLAHPVRVEPGTRLVELLRAEELPVNSMHHQGVRELAPGLRPTAFAPDGLIEGFEGTDGRFLLAVQWHPEELAETCDRMRRLFTAFIDAARPS
jgi:putative glutamine amidotransferase